MSGNESGQVTGATIIAGVFAVLLAIALLIGGAAGCKSYTRYQKRADAHNKVKVEHAKLGLYEIQRLQAIKLAQVKREQAIGQKLANIEIASRLTPLFVQYEMIEALKAIAASGKNNSVVYIPSGANGVPLVSVSGQPQVYGGQAEPTK